jgi:uncharacterized protein (DUF4415 family)
MTGKKRVMGSDLAKIDAHEIQPEEYAEIPELTDEQFDRAEDWQGDTFIPRRPGRPPSAHPKQQVTLRLDADVIEHFRATGPGWQTRINEALRQCLEPSARARGRKQSDGLPR